MTEQEYKKKRVRLLNLIQGNRRKLNSTRNDMGSDIELSNKIQKFEQELFELESAHKNDYRNHSEKE